MSDLFPLRATRILPRHPADADVDDNACDDVPHPDVTVTDREPIGVLYSPDGQHCRAVYDREQVTFGFQPR